MSIISKEKKPEKIIDPAIAENYRKSGTMFVEEGITAIGCRYDQVTKRKLRKPNGEVFQNNVTLSQPSSEVLILFKEAEEWFIIMRKQSHSPYVVEVDGILYSRMFLEQATGLIEKGQDFQSVAITKVEQKLGVKLIYLSELIIPRIFRHVSYSDEVSKLYLGIAEQKPNKNSNNLVEIISLEKAKNEFKEYLNGEKNNFFGYDIPDISMLSMAIFFWKLDSKEIDLNNLRENLL